jgi:hypothetical protein
VVGVVRGTASPGARRGEEPLEPSQPDLGGVSEDA